MTHARRYLRIYLAAVALVAVAVVVALSGCGGSTAPAATKPDGVVATVNGTPVHQSDVAGIRAERRLVGKAAGGAKDPVDEAIDRELVRQEAARLGVTAEPAAVDARVALMQKEAGGADKLQTALQGARMSDAQFRQSAADAVLAENLQNEKYAQLSAAPTAVQAYYRRHLDSLFTQASSVHLAAIMVRTKMVAENALQRLKEGRPFAEVAHQFSMDPESRDSGGDLGWLLTESLPAPLQKAILSAGRGVIERPVGGGITWYVLKVKGLQRGGAVPFATVRKSLSDQLTTAKRAKALQGWLAEERRQATITRS